VNRTPSAASDLTPACDWRASPHVGPIDNLQETTNMPTSTGPMACPVDGATLVMSERAGIEIDYCPTCRGVWLDRGELDKIIERNSEASAPAPQAQAPQPTAPPQQQPWGQQQQQPYRGHDNYGHKPHKRRKGFLEELFD